MTTVPELDVLVVGAGPTGLALGCALWQAGVETLVVDQAAEGVNSSRAAVVHARTLELLGDYDVTPRLLAEGLVVPVFTVRDRRRTLATIDFSGIPSPYPYTLMLSQSRTETILGRRLAELGGRVDRPWAATGVTEDATGATVVLENPEGGRRAVRARFVVGADGMHSTVRTAAGIGYTGGRYAQSFVLADVQMDWPLPEREVQLFLSPAGLVVVAPLPGGHHRVVATVDSATEPITESDVQALLDERGPGSARVHRVVWGSRFRVHHRVADSYRRGPLLLAGDAAHVHSPAGGQGMNTGIQDAIDLGRTLADIVRNGGDEAALDGYQQRRRPVAQQVVALTDRATRLATLRHPMARAGRNAVISVAGRVPPASRRLALQLSEVNVPATPGPAAPTHTRR